MSAAKRAIERELARNDVELGPEDYCDNCGDWLNECGCTPRCGQCYQETVEVASGEVLYCDHCGTGEFTGRDVL